MPHRRLLVGTLGSLFPLAGIMGVERTEMAPIAPQAPVPTPTSMHLIDDTIPAFGRVHYQVYRKDSRVESLYHKIRGYAGSVEHKVLAGLLFRPAQAYVQPEGENGATFSAQDTNPVAQPRALLPEEEQLAALLGELAVAREEILRPNHYEEWHLDNSWRDLKRAGELLTLGIGEDRYAKLEDLHAAWHDHYHSSLRKARAEMANEMLRDPESGITSPSSALAEAEAKIAKIAYPPMSLTKEYPPVEVPAVMTDAMVKAQIAEMQRAKEREEKAKAREMAEAKREADKEAARQAKEAEAAAKAAAKEAATEDPAEVATSEKPAAPPMEKAEPFLVDLGNPDIALAKGLYDKGNELYHQGIDAGNTTARDDLLNQAELVLSQSVDLLNKLAEGGDTSVQDLMVQVNKIKYGSVKSARTDAQKNKEARKLAKEAIEAVKAAVAKAAAEEPVVEEPVAAPPAEAPVVEEPVAAPPAEAPVVEEPVAAPAEEPVVEEPVAAPPAEEPPAEEEKPKEPKEKGKTGGVLDDFTWPE